MTNQHRVQVVPGGFLIGDEVCPVYSGSIHYWRHRREHWQRILGNVRDMGFRFVDTYVPWNVHEIRPGQYDFGELTPEKDVSAFFDACRHAGLFVLCRPGPHINAELPFFGYPERVVNNPDIQMRTASGAPAVLPVANIPIAAPSYASEQFYDAVAGYFDAVAPVLKPHLYPDGPIVAVQADNEMSLFFRTRCYDVDYHAEAIQHYRQLLARKYGTVEELNRQYSASYTSFDQVEPPREFLAHERADLPYYLDWVEYQEAYITDGIVRIRAMLEERGLTGVPYYHNYPTFYPEVPFRMGALEDKLDIAGVDAYPRPDQYPMVKRGAQLTSTMSRLPFIPEFGSGVWAWYRPQPAEDHLFNIRAAFMHGIRAINYYMLADRDRWLNTPIHEDGEPRAEMFDMFQRWNAQLTRLGWLDLRPERPVLILTPRCYERLRHVAIEGSIPYDWLMNFYVQLPADLFLSTQSFGGRDEIQQRLPTWIEAMRQALEGAGVPYALADSDMTAEKLAEYRAVVCPTFEWIDPDVLEKLDDYVRQGGHLICGPRLPTETLDGQPLGRWPIATPSQSAPRLDLDSTLWLEDVDLWMTADDREEAWPYTHRFGVGEGKVTVLSGVFPAADLLVGKFYTYRRLGSDLLRLLGEAGITPLISLDNPELDVSLLSSSERRVMCIANATDHEQSASVRVLGAQSFTDVDTGECSGSWGTLQLTMPSWSIKLWEIGQ